MKVRESKEKKNTERMTAEAWRKTLGLQPADNTMAKADIIVGIDPDTTDNGFALLNPRTKELTLLSLSTAEVLDKLEGWYVHAQFKPEDVVPIVVVVEAGWLNASNWHLRYGDNARIAASKGYDVGANHQVGKIIAEWCKLHEMPYILQKPLPKHWQTADGKISVKELQSIVGIYGIKLPKPCTQDMRDAALLAWNYAGLPMIIQPSVKPTRKKR